MEQLADLSPLAIIVFGATLALIFGVRYLKLLLGTGVSPEKAAASVQVAAVIVEAAGEALNMTLMKSNWIAKEKIRVNKQLADELDNIREEIRIQREIGRREGMMSELS